MLLLIMKLPPPPHPMIASSIFTDSQLMTIFQKETVVLFLFFFGNHRGPLGIRE